MDDIRRLDINEQISMINQKVYSLARNDDDFEVIMVILDLVLIVCELQSGQRFIGGRG